MPPSRHEIHPPRKILVVVTVGGSTNSGKYRCCLIFLRYLAAKSHYSSQHQFSRYVKSYTHAATPLNLLLLKAANLSFSLFPLYRMSMLSDARSPRQRRKVCISISVNGTLQPHPGSETSWQERNSTTDSGRKPTKT